MTTVTTTTQTIDPTSVTKSKVVEPSLFGAGSSFGGGTDPITGVFSDLTGSDFLAARQMSLSAEVRMPAEYNVKEKRILKSAVESQGELLKAREEEIESLKARLLLKEAEAAKAIRLRVEASNFETVKKSLRDEANALRERNVSLKKERDALDVKVMELETSAMSKERELTDLNAVVTSVKLQNNNLVDQVHELEISSFGIQEKVTEQFYPNLLTTISGRRWLLTHEMELAITKCLNSPEYLSALETAIEKGMQDRLAAGITHGKEGRVLTDFATYNLSAEANYISTLQQLQNVDFPLLAELKSKKDASIEAIMEIIRLEDPLAEKLGLNELQPHVDYSRVRQIKENITNHISVLRDVFVSLAKPFSTSALKGVEGTSGAVPTTATTTTLSTTLA
nr:transposase (putative), gypsy type [Tanacetum cinerariifolium]